MAAQWGPSIGTGGTRRPMTDPFNLMKWIVHQIHSVALLPWPPRMMIV